MYHFEHKNNAGDNVSVTIIVLTLLWQYHLRNLLCSTTKASVSLATWTMYQQWNFPRRSTLQVIYKENEMKAVIEKGLLASMECHMRQNLIITEILKSMMEIHD